MKKHLIFYIVTLFPTNNIALGQIISDSLVNYIYMGVNEKRELANIPKANFDKNLSIICSEMIDIDIENNGQLNEMMSQDYINPRTSKLYDFGDVRYSYIKLSIIKEYYKGIEKQISKDFFEIYDKYNNGEYFILNSKNRDLSNGVCHLGVCARLVNDQIYIYFIIMSETKDDFVYKP